MRFSRTVWAASAAACALAACGGGGGGYGGGGNPPMATGYELTSLVADSGAGIYGARYNDPNLVDGWGLAFGSQGYVSVVAHGSAKSTTYDGNGIAQPAIVATPPGPTGIVFNGSLDFAVTQANITGASTLIYATDGGLIAGWAPTVDPAVAITAYDGSGAGKSYQGLTLAAQGSASFLYATDFHNAAVDVFDKTFAPVAVPGAFVDPALPTGYAPYGIQAIGNRIYVTYAKQDAAAAKAMLGAGLGAVVVYDTAGALIKELVVGSVLNAPWGVALAPAGFGRFANALLVANLGDGRINAFDPGTGAFLGALSQTDGRPIAVGGLWGIAFGNGLHNQPATTLFLAAGPGNGAQGLFARIDVR